MKELSCRNRFWAEVELKRKKKNGKTKKVNVENLFYSHKKRHQLCFEFEVLNRSEHQHQKKI